MFCSNNYAYTAFTPIERSPCSQSAGFPKLVVSGGHSAAFHAVCDTLERELPSERAVVAGAGHSVQRTGGPYNEVLAAFLERAE